jgi:hypothetical protein
MRLPGGGVAEEYAVEVRSMYRNLSALMREVCVKWHWCHAVAMAAAANGCDHKGSPLPYDGSREALLFA